MSAVPSRRRATVLLTVGGYANTGISVLHGLLLIPLYLYYLGASLYGFWLASGGMLGMLALANFGVSSMLIQRVAQAYGKNDNQQAAAYFINGTVVYLGICVLYLFLGGAASFFLPAILHVQGEQAVLLQDCFRLALVGMALGIFNESVRCLAQALLRPVFTLVSLVSCRLAGIVITVVLLISGYGLWALPIGTLAAECAIFLLNAFDAMRLLRMLQARISIQWTLIREYLRTSPALFMARLGSTFAHESEPLLITVFLGSEITTAYMVTRKIADMFFQILNQLVGGSMGTFAHLASEGQSEKTNRIASLLVGVIFIFGLMGSALYVLFNADFVSLWVGKEFILDPWVTVLIGIGFFLLILRSIIAQLLLGLGDFIYTSLVVFCEGVGRITCAVALIYSGGVWGAPAALVLASMFSVAFLFVRSRKLLSIAPQGGAIVTWIVTVAASIGICFLAYQPGVYSDSWVSFAISVILFTFVFLAVFAVIHWKSLFGFYRQRFPDAS